MSGPQPVLILAVDDNELVLDLIVTALEDAGYGVLPATSADEALALLETRAMDLGGMVTDVNLGRGQPSGWDVGRRAYELNANLPIVYISGDSAHHWRSKGGARSVLIEKPFAPDELAAAVGRLRNFSE